MVSHRYDQDGVVILRYDYQGVGHTLHATALHNRNDPEFQQPFDYIAGRFDAHYPVPAVVYETWITESGEIFVMPNEAR